MRTGLRPFVVVGMAATVAVIGAGCGGTASGGGTTNANRTPLTARAKAVRFSECLRANGVGDFPDPNAAGQFPAYGISVTPAVWKRATDACKSLQPPGALSAKLTPAQESAALRFAQCVRAHGVPDFPDPVSGQPLIDTTHIPSANRPGGMTILNAATHTCGHFVAEQLGGH
jgi:hypothetical protein